MAWTYDVDKKWVFKKYKCPVNGLSIGTLCYIHEENIKEDNVEPNDE